MIDQFLEDFGKSPEGYWRTIVYKPEFGYRLVGRTTSGQRVYWETLSQKWRRTGVGWQSSREEAIEGQYLRE